MTYSHWYFTLKPDFKQHRPILDLILAGLLVVDSFFQSTFCSIILLSIELFVLTIVSAFLKPMLQVIVVSPTLLLFESFLFLYLIL